MATFGESFKSGIDLSVDELPAELLRGFDLQQYIVPTRLRDATEDGSLEAKIILLKTIQQPARARWFSIDHNQLIWYGFLSCVEFCVMGTVQNRHTICESLYVPFPRRSKEQ